MSIATELSAALFQDIVVDVPLNNNYPLYAETEVEVVYGTQGLLATINVDYTVELNEPNFNSFTITPKQYLIDKINNLIAVPPTDATESNFVVVRRKMSYKTSVEPETVRNTPFLSKEIDRIHMKMIQLAERVARAISLPATVVGDLLVAYTVGAPVEGKAPVWRGNQLVPEIDAANIAAAEGFASQTAALLADAQDVLADITVLAGQVAANAALLPKNNYTAVTDPTVNDDIADGYSPGSQWVNTTNGDRFLMSNNALGAAVWNDVTGIAPEDLGTMAFEAAADYATLLELNARVSVSKAADRALNADDPYNFSYVDGAWQKGTVSSNCEITFTFPANKINSFILELANGGAYTITWPGEMEWAGGIEPVLTAVGRDHLCIYTDGTKVYGSLVGKDVK